jgi:SAM-dependent methyltransferase
MDDVTAADSWLDVNCANWDERVAIHLDSNFYDVPGFLAGRSTLRPQECAELGDVGGKRLVHLQCHFGLDTLSWARKGAEVLGIDFSPAAIDAARSIAKQAELTAHFECADVYGIDPGFDGTFDIVYTGLGALCWLPDIDRWARVVARLLKPGGELYLHEFHPFEWIFDERETQAKYDYFTAPAGLHIDLPGSYADPAATTRHNATVQWNHGIGAVVTALVQAGLHIRSLVEHDGSVVQRWPFMVKQEGGWRMPPGRSNLPLLYTLRAGRPGS